MMNKFIHWTNILLQEQFLPLNFLLSIINTDVLHIPQIVMPLKIELKFKQVTGQKSLLCVIIYNG